MNSVFNINNTNHNYSGYGSTLNDFDSFDDVVPKTQNSNRDVFNEILNQLGVDIISMNEIINIITKNKNVKFTFIRTNNDFQLLYFKDDHGHLTPVPLKKIIETRNLISNI